MGSDLVWICACGSEGGVTISTRSRQTLPDCDHDAPLRYVHETNDRREDSKEEGLHRGHTGVAHLSTCLREDGWRILTGMDVYCTFSALGVATPMCLDCLRY